MKKLLLVAGAVLVLVAAPAPAKTLKTVTVDISKLGFVPSTVTVQAGDSVTWTNKDTANHQVVCAKCSPAFTSPVLTPNTTFTQVFANVGTFTVIDPLNKNKKGTVKVTAAPPTLSVSATPAAVGYGHPTVVSGSLSTGAANQKVDILAQPCGQKDPKVVNTATTTTGGAFTYTAPTPLATAYSARYKPATGTAVTTTPINVSVRPLLTLTRVAKNRFSIQVTTAESFVGKAVLFQRYNAKTRRWSTVRTLFFSTKAPVATPAGSTLSGVAFRAKLRRGLRVKALLPASQAAPCYLGATAAARS